MSRKYMGYIYIYCGPTKTVTKSQLSSQKGIYDSFVTVFNLCQLLACRKTQSCHIVVIKGICDGYTTVYVPSQKNVYFFVNLLSRISFDGLCPVTKNVYFLLIYCHGLVLTISNATYVIIVIHFAVINATLDRQKYSFYDRFCRHKSCCTLL